MGRVTLPTRLLEFSAAPLESPGKSEPLFRKSGDIRGMVQGRRKNSSLYQSRKKKKFIEHWENLRGGGSNREPCVCGYTLFLKKIKLYIIFISLSVWRSEDSSWGVILSFHHVGSRAGTQVTRFEGRSLTH